MQKKIKISKTDSATSLRKKILKIENKIYPQAIKLVCKTNF